jgi:hypothetical protein
MAGTLNRFFALVDAFFLTESGGFEYGLIGQCKWLVGHGKRLSWEVTAGVVAMDGPAELFREYYYCYGYFRRSVRC